MSESNVSIGGQCYIKAQRGAECWVLWAFSPQGSTVGSASITPSQVETLMMGVGTVAGQSITLRPSGIEVEVCVGESAIGRVPKAELLRNLQEC